MKVETFGNSRLSAKLRSISRWFIGGSTGPQTTLYPVMGGSAIGTRGTCHDNLTVTSLLPTSSEYARCGGSLGSRATTTNSNIRNCLQLWIHYSSTVFLNACFTGYQQCILKQNLSNFQGFHGSTTMANNFLLIHTLTIYICEFVLQVFVTLSKWPVSLTECQWQWVH